MNEEYQASRIGCSNNIGNHFRQSVIGFGSKRKKRVVLDSSNVKYIVRFGVIDM